MHVHALSGFSKMSFNVFPSKGQKCIHAYVESTFRVLEGRDRVQSYQGPLAESSRYRPLEEVNDKGRPQQTVTVTLVGIRWNHGWLHCHPQQSSGLTECRLRSPQVRYDRPSKHGSELQTAACHEVHLGFQFEWNFWVRVSFQENSLTMGYSSL